MTRPLDVIVALALAACWIAGIALFPHSLGPGRSEEAGVSLEPFVTPHLGIPSDWFVSSALVVELPGRLRITSQRTGVALISRSIPVFPDECYELLASGRTIDGGAALAVADEEATATLKRVDIPSSTSAREQRFGFDSATYRRVALTVFAQGGSVVELGAVSVRRLGQKPPC